MHFHNQDHGGPPTLTNQNKARKRGSQQLMRSFPCHIIKNSFQVSIKSNELPGVT
jgi:hypothetical protein